jgi:hypothetical protein
MTSAKSGQILFGIAMVGVGIVNLIFGDFLAGLIPVSAAAPARQFFMFVVSVSLVGSGVAIVLEKQLWIATLIPTWIPARLFWAYFVGGAFIASATSIVLNKKLSLAMTLLATMFFLWVLVLHLPRVIASPQHEPEWTSALVALTMGAIALMLHPKH